jgi:LysM repeat protein
LANVKYSFRGGEPIGYKLPKRRRRGGCVLIIIALVAGAVLWYVLAGRGGGKVMPPVEVDNPVIPVKPKEVKTEPGDSVKTGNNKAGKPKAGGVKVPVELVKSPVFVLSGKKLVEFRALCDQAENNFRQENYWRARNEALAALKMVPQASPLWDKAAELLGKTNAKLINSDVPCPKKVLYTIEPGDVLQKIARKHNTSIEQVLKSNKMPKDKYRLWAGNTLKIYRGDWKIKISKKYHKLYLYDGDSLFKAFKIGIGKQDRTPVGEFKVAARIKEPDWYAPNGQVYEFGSKGNVLGTRWIALKTTGKTAANLKGYGIHGTWDRESIGKARSNGCIRMLNEQVEELFRIIPLGTPVEITEE